MAAKIAVFTILLAFSKVQSQNQVPYGQACPVPNCNINALNQGSCNTQLNQPQNIRIQPSNYNKGIKATPLLKIVPCQKYNLQAIPLSQYTGSNFQRNPPQNCAYDGFQQNVQATPVQSQVPTSPPQLIQPSICGPSPVITSPVSSINIPPSACNTIIDHSLSKILANALQMIIANEFFNSAINKNIVNQDYLDVPVTDTVPDFDLADFLQSLNSKQSGQVTNQILTVPSQTSEITTPSQYQTPVSDCNTPLKTDDWSQLFKLLQDRQTTMPEIDWDKVKNFLNKQNEQTVIPSKSQRPAYETQSTDSNNYILDAFAAYFGCDASEVSTSSLPTVSEIYIPEEIPVKLVCTYGYMPTTVPVINMEVKSLDDSGNSFIFGC